LVNWGIYKLDGVAGKNVVIYVKSGNSRGSTEGSMKTILIVISDGGADDRRKTERARIGKGKDSQQPLKRERGTRRRRLYKTEPHLSEICCLGDRLPFKKKKELGH